MPDERGVFGRTVEKRPVKASMTLLSRIDVCPFSGALYLDYKGGVQTHAMARGELVHSAIEYLVNQSLESGEVEVPPEVAKDIAQAMIEERTDLVLPAAEQEVVRVALWNWASGFRIDPASIVGVEVMLEMQVGNWMVRGKLDLCEIAHNVGIVTDWKTSLWIPSREDYANDFQAQTYALLMAEGIPEGEEMPIGKGLSEFHTYQRFPRHDPSKRALGDLAYQYAEFDRQQLFDFKRTLEGHLAKLDRGLEAGEWAASPGSHCQTCPASSECPIPPHLRDVRTIGSEGDAREVAERILFLGSERDDLNKSLKLYVDDNGAVRVGDVEFGFTYTESERADKAAIKELIERAGENPEDYFKKAPSTRFGKQKVKAA